MFKWLVTRTGGLGAFEVTADECAVSDENALLFVRVMKVPLDKIQYVDEEERERGYAYKRVIVLALAEGEWRRVDLFE